MRTRVVFPLLSSLFVLLFTALLLLWASPPVPGWADSPAWTDLSGPRAGPAQAVAVNPDYPSDQTILAGGGHDLFYASWKGYGIFRSLDGGATWGAPGGPTDGAVLDAAFSPRWHDDGIAIAGLWQGVWITHDRGATWQQLSGGEMSAPGFVGAVAIGSPAAGEYTLLAGGAWGGLYRSADQGATWSSLFDPGGVSRILFDPAAPAKAWAAAGQGLWHSTDGGLQWTRVTTTTTAYDVALGPQQRVFSIFDGRAWYTTDEGSTWHPVGNSDLQGLDKAAASADGLGLFMAAGAALYRYDVAANRLVTATTNLPIGDIKQIAVSPQFGTDQTIWIGAADGVWVSHDAGASFVRAPGFTTFALRSVRAAGSSGGSPGDLFAAGEEGIWRLRGGTWQSLNAKMLGDAATVNSAIAVSPAYDQDHTLFTVNGLANAMGSSLYRSQDGGDTWSAPLASLEYINQIVLSPGYGQDRRVFLVAVQQIWESQDGGDTWAKEPYWDFTHQVRMMAASPALAQDHVLVAVGNGIYRSTDGGSSWQVVAGPPVLDPNNAQAWSPNSLVWAKSGHLYLAVSAAEAQAPYLRHSQIWTSSDKGQTWTQLPAAPNLPINALATGPSAIGSGEALYAGTYDDNEYDDRVIVPDLYVSRNYGGSWSNLGAIPGGTAPLDAAANIPDRLYAGGQGVWHLETGLAPTATPNPARELLSNLSFEYTGVWRIPDTPYDAAYNQEQHYAGYWSMRSGITAPSTNVRSYSDFSQDVTLPATGTVTLRFQRWAQASVSVTGDIPGQFPGNLAAQAADPATLDEFYAALAATAGDLQYGLVIEQPSGKIHYLYKGLDDQKSWKAETFDLTSYLGKSVRLQFGTYNDGSGPAAAQYFDAFSLQLVGPAQPTPTVTPPATATPKSRTWLPYLKGGLIKDNPW
ncbi:MAG: sialidase family protein [Caldilineaceae bacterium]